MIYAEWTLYGKFDNRIFNSWDEYFAATFNPDTILLVVREIK